MKKDYFSDEELHLLDATTQEKVYMWYLKDKILNPVREALGKMTCTSGHRNEKHNREVGGAKNSHHLCNNGYAAADLIPSNVALEELFKYIRDSYSYAELILEHDQGIIHVSMNIDPEKNTKRTSRRKLVDGKKVYY